MTPNPRTNSHKDSPEYMLTDPAGMLVFLQQQEDYQMDVNDLTIGQAKELAAMFASKCGENKSSPAPQSTCAIPVLVCTDKRGVVYGLTYDPTARPINLSHARMALYWSADVGGVFGLAEKGPTAGCKISATVSDICLEGVTAVFTVDPDAEKAWKAAKVQGR